MIGLISLMLNAFLAHTDSFLNMTLEFVYKEMKSILSECKNKNEILCGILHCKWGFDLRHDLLYDVKDLLS